MEDLSDAFEMTLRCVWLGGISVIQVYAWAYQFVPQKGIKTGSPTYGTHIWIL